MTLNQGVMPYFTMSVYIFGCSSILWPPLKNRMPKNLHIAKFGHLVDKKGKGRIRSFS